MDFVAVLMPARARVVETKTRELLHLMSFGNLDLGFSFGIAPSRDPQVFFHYSFGASRAFHYEAHHT